MVGVGDWVSPGGFPSQAPWANDSREVHAADLVPVAVESHDWFRRSSQPRVSVILNAEELGITQANVEEMEESENEDVRRLLGVDGSFGEGIGLGNDWAANVIEALGNYGEIFQRNVGAESELGIARGLNALWNDGGIQYAPPIK